MRMRKVFVLGAAIVLAGAATGTLLLTNDNVQETLPAQPNTSTALQVLDACRSSAQDQRAGCLVNATLSAYQAVGDMPSLLGAVRDKIESDPDFQGVTCHGTFHEIGKKAFAEMGDEALRQGIASCSGGYYHGVLQAGGSASEAKSMCETLTNPDEHADCMHGAGHAIYLVEPDLGNALEYCAGDMQNACVAGYFMELAQANQRTPKALTYCEEPGLSTEVLFSCYNGLLSDIATMHPKEVAKWCTTHATSEDMLPRDCWGQLGSGIASGVNERQATSDSGAAKETQELCKGSEVCLSSAALVFRKFVNRPEVADAICARVSATPSDLGYYAEGCPV